ncbi:MAG: ATPase [Armatimonadota bacterium]|nr:ATPase [Armatimonadota bacterium]
MPTLIADCGSSWSKIKNLDDGEVIIQPTSDVLKNRRLRFDIATGHLGRERAKKYENEIIALAQGSLKLVPESDFTVVDIGSRDTKFVRFVGRKLRKMNWNQACGANTGFTLELLAKYYDVDFNTLPSSDKKIPVTCGIFAIEQIFDSIIRGGSPYEALAQFIHGIAFNVYNFAQRPEKLYVSGGLCANKCFLDSLARYCEVIPLGRHVLLEGLY